MKLPGGSGLIASRSTVSPDMAANLSGDDGHELVLGMAVWRHDEAGWKLEPEHERPVLGRAAEQDGGLRARRQRGRRRSPLDGVGGHHRVVRVGGLQRTPGKQHGAAEREGGELNDAGRERGAFHDAVLSCCVKFHGRQRFDQCRVMTISRYSLGTTMVPSPERLNRSMSASRSFCSVSRLAGSRAAKALSSGP